MPTRKKRLTPTRRIKFSPRHKLDAEIEKLLKQWVVAGSAKDSLLSNQDFEGAAACIKVRHQTADGVCSRLVQIFGV